MFEGRAYRTAALCVQLTLWAPGLVFADVFQFADVLYVGDLGFTGDSQSVSGDAAHPIDHDIVAQSSALGLFSARAAVGQHGNVGVSAGILEPGGRSRLEAEVSVSSDDFVNLTGVPQLVAANFVIDGGAMTMIAARNATISYELSLLAETVNGPLGHFFSQGTMTATAAGAIEFATSGRDIGATLDPAAGRVEIPLSFQEFEIGVLEANERLELRYSFEFEILLGSFLEPGSSEGLGAIFSDPFTLSGSPVLGSLTFRPVAVPEPATLALLGAAALLGRRRLSGRRARDGSRPGRH